MTFGNMKSKPIVIFNIFLCALVLVKYTEKSAVATLTAADWANRDIVTNVIYIQDHRNNLCFAKYYSSPFDARAAVGGIATVPCEQVKAMLVNP
jgi:hypothetical protein